MQTIEMFNSIDVLSKTIEQRQCRFAGEHLFGWEWPYSYSSCHTRLRINLELSICNCTIHTAPIKCKFTKFNFFSQLRKKKLNTHSFFVQINIYIATIMDYFA